MVLPIVQGMIKRSTAGLSRRTSCIGVDWNVLQFDSNL
jgi:hypothetical protein